MASRARRRNKSGRFVKGGASKNPGRKRGRRKARSRAAVVVVNPKHRARRRRAKANPPTHHRRRRARRNPPSLGSVFEEAVTGAGRGFAVVGGQVVTRKIRGAAQGIVPATTNVSTGLPGVATTAGAALAITVLAAMLTPPKYRRAAEFVVAGAWSEAINCGLAQTPIAPYLSAFSPTRRSIVRGYVQPARVRGVQAWPAALPRSGMSAWPGMRVAGNTMAHSGAGV